MISGAGHDAAYIARVAPTTMIFVPCAGGISHNEAEFDEFRRMRRGCAGLAQRGVGIRPALGLSDYRVFSKISRPISMRRISLVPAPIS